MPWETGLRVQPLSAVWVPCGCVASSLTIKDRPAVLGGGGQRQAGGIELVAVVPDADLELEGVVDVLQHGGRVEGREEGVLAPPEVLLETERAARESQGGGRETPGWGGHMSGRPRP